jgi:hypothetical protein
MLRIMAVWAVSGALAGATWAEPSYRYGPCNGTYGAFSGQPALTAPALSMPVNTALRAPARLDMRQCGREMLVTIADSSAVLYQDVFDERLFEGDIALGDGAQRTLTLRMDDDRNLRGALVAKQGPVTAKRPIWLILDTPSETRFEGCADDAEPALPNRALSEQAAIFSELLAEAGLSPAPGLQFGDYIETRVLSETETRVKIRLSEDGNVLPRPDVAYRQLDQDAAVCLASDRLDAAVRLIEFKVQMVDNDPFVFAREIDATTGVVDVQAEGVRTTGPGEALASGMRDAWAKLGPELGPMTNGVAGGN